MTVFMVERSLKGISMDGLAEAQQRAIQTAERFRREGTSIRYMRTTFVPEDSCCMCLFEAENSNVVERLNRDARIPFDRVVPVLDLAPR